MKSLKNLYRIGNGPSSSHTMGPQKCAEKMLQDYPFADHFEVFLYGSLALTGKGHLTDFAIENTLGKEKCIIHFDIIQNIPHPNTLKIVAYSKEKIVGEKTFISIGGGAIEIVGEERYNEEEVYPFENFADIRNYCNEHNLTLPEVVYHYEGDEIKEYLLQVYKVMVEAINRGLNKTGVLPGGLNVERKAQTLYKTTHHNAELDHLRLITAYAYATSEENAAGGVIVTAPTCGACGVLPAALYFLKNQYNLSEEKIIDALAVASIFGNVIKQNAAISGAFAGCQSEIGSACSMTAAACAYLDNQSIDVIEYAAEIAMEHHLGLTCDPIQGLVQIPCIERNAVASLRALEASSIASILFSSRKISFDMVVKTMYETGKDLSKKYKETSLGGLATNYQNKDE